jgi:DNA (cytosine-5)-methyltransferase 1
LSKGNLRVLDLFCGPGGFSTGFEAAGFEVVGAYDKDKWAVTTYSANHNIAAQSIDLAKFDMADMPDVDLILGGPPCTQFSSAKSNKTRNVLDGLLLVQAFLRCVYIKKPKYWIMENVPTIQKYLPPSIPLRYIGIDEDGYLNIPQKAELIAADYGVPQRRKRYLIGNFPLPTQTHRKSGSEDLLLDRDLPNWVPMKHVLKAFPSPLAEISKRKVEDPNYGFSIASEDLTDQFYDASLSKSEARSIEQAKTNHPYMGVLAWPDKIDEPARTVVATQLGRETLIIGPDSCRADVFRRATVRECASLQSFPISYQFFGSTYGIKYRLVGDAVPPLMAFAIAKGIAEIEGHSDVKQQFKSEFLQKANQLADRLEPRKKRVNPKRKVSIMLPAKEVRGCRAEFLNSGFIDKKVEFNGFQFNLPAWRCDLVLGEGAASTRRFEIDGSHCSTIEGHFVDDPRISQQWISCKRKLDKIVADMPPPSEFFGRYISHIEKGSPLELSARVSSIVDKFYPKAVFDKIRIDLSKDFEHPKSSKIRIRIALGIYFGFILSKSLNDQRG